MNIGELIDLLTEKAAVDDHDQPGLKAPVAIAWCDGENLTSTSELDVQVMTHLARGSAHAFLMLRGHPHLDPEAMTMRGVAADADSALTKWSRTDPESPSA